MRSRWYYVIAGISLVLIILWLHIALIAQGLGGIGAIFVTLSMANLFWLLPAFGLFGVGYILRAIRWWLLLRPFKMKTNPAKLFPMLVGGIFLTYVVPLRAGDIATPYWLKEKTGTRFTAGLSSIVLARFLDFASLILIIILSVVLIFGTVTGEAINAILVPVLLGVIFIVFFFLIRNDRFVNFMSRILGRLFKPSETLKKEVPEFVENFAVDLRTDVGSWNTGWAFLLSLPLWIVETMKLTYLGLAFNVDITIVQSVFVAAISYVGGHALGILLPAGIAIFLFQFIIFNNLLVLVFGSASQVVVFAASIALMDGLVYIIGLTILGVPSIALMGRKYRKLQQEASPTEVEEKPPPKVDG
jgi:uncharacterized protein (TIRG00374 family)